MNIKSLNNYELSFLLTDFWKWDKEDDLFKYYKKDKEDNIIIEYLTKQFIQKDGTFQNCHYFCYYWHTDEITEILKNELEPALSFKYSNYDLNNKFRNYLGKDYNFKYKLHQTKNFINKISIAYDEKEVDIKKLFR
jgi:hypothetical protein